MLTKAQFAHILLHSTPHSLDTKVVIATQVSVNDTLCCSVGDNTFTTFATLNVAVFEELLFIVCTPTFLLEEEGGEGG